MQVDLYNSRKMVVVVVGKLNSTSIAWISGD